MKSLIKIFILFFIISFSFEFDPAHPPESSINKNEYYSNIHWLALNIYYESRNQPTLGKIAVGVVTLNRVKDPRFSNTIEGVIKESKQFSWYTSKKTYYPKDKDAWNECVNIAKFLLSLDTDHSIIKMFDGITHFHATYVKPEWKRSMIKVAHIGDHIFYKPKVKKT